MPIDKLKLTFHGATRSVTGSMHLIECNGKRILLDCGLVQGPRKEAFEQNRRPAVDPKSVDTILLSHAHIDHSGNLPTFARLGFRGRVIATPATADLCEVMLRDSANVQVRQVELVNRLRREQGKHLFESLYDEGDVEEIMSRFEPAPYGQTFEVCDGLRATFLDAGHILGSALTLLEFGANGSSTRLLFTGDIGRKGCVILRDPVEITQPHYVISESTYGNRTHPPSEEVKAQLAEMVETVRRRKSRLIIPSFAVGRLQTIIYYLNQLHGEGRVHKVPVHVDSPLASKATEVFRQHPECYDGEVNEFILNGGKPFSFKMLKYAESIADSKKLNNQKGPMVIVSSSGMCEGGRVLHHLAHAVGDPMNIILLTGYQASHTLGRKLLDGWNPVNILGHSHYVRARVETIGALSAHADVQELADYFQTCKAKPRQAFLVHGELEQAEALKARLRGDLKWKQVEIPEAGQEFELEAVG